MRNSSEILVVGGGVIGTACALHLIRRGHDVLWVSDDTTPGIASLGNAGHIPAEQIYPLASLDTVFAALPNLLTPTSPVSIRPAHTPAILPWLARFCWSGRPAQYRRGVRTLRALTEAALPALRRLLADTPAANQLVEAGHLLVSARSTDPGLDRALARWDADGVGHTALGPVERDTWLGGVVRPSARAWHYPHSAHVQSPADLLGGLGEAFTAAGGTRTTGCVDAVQPLDGGYACTLSSSTTLNARTLILAAGPDTARLSRFTGLRLPLACEGGYHLHLPRWTPPLRAPVVHAERKVILTPMSHGLRISGFVEFAGWKAVPDPRRFEALRDHLQAIMPGTPVEHARAWYGFRPSLPDHLPAIGAVPGHPGLICATGHQHLGLTLSAVTAEIIGDLVENRQPGITLETLRPDRFGWHRLTRPLRDRRQAPI